MATAKASPSASQASLPTFTFTPPSSNLPVNPSSVYGLLNTPPISAVNTGLPAAASYLGPNSPYLQAAMKQIQNYGYQENSAIPGYLAQRRMSGTKAGNAIGQAMQTGNNYMTGLIGGSTEGQALNQMSMTLAQQAMQAYGMDIKGNEGMLNDLAQAIGQELTQQQNLSMFNQQLSQNAQLAHQGMNYGLLGAGIGMAGKIGAGYEMGNLRGINTPQSTPVTPYSGMMNLSGINGSLY